MKFETVTSGGCSYVIGCDETCAAVLIDPELGQIDRYMALAARDGLRIRYLIETHTHADHFSATQQLARQLKVPVVMHATSPAPFVDLRLRGGELLAIAMHHAEEGQQGVRRGWAARRGIDDGHLRVRPQRQGHRPAQQLIR
jgi:glyoxylase-like metal-dependent hydrolase (beta-lactamase superfamily II)